MERFFSCGAGAAPEEAARLEGAGAAAAAGLGATAAGLGAAAEGLGAAAAGLGAAAAAGLGAAAGMFAPCSFIFAAVAIFTIPPPNFNFGLPDFLTMV